MALMLGASRLLAMANDIASFHPIIICVMSFWLISHSIILQLWGLFQDHLSLNQFEISALKDCETIPFNIKALFNLHLDLVVMQVDIENVFNNIFRTTIFFKLWDVEGLLARIIPFTKLFYGVQFSFYYQHGQREERITVMESSSGTRNKVTPEEVFCLPWFIIKHS